MIQTTGDLITFCLRVSGVCGSGQTPQAEDAMLGLQLLVSMIAQWQRKRWLVWNLVETVCVSTGSPTYTIGPGAQFACPRPDKINSAYARLLNTGQPNLLDIPLFIIESKEDFNTIAFKTIQSMPGAIFYDSAWPSGTIHVYPVAPSGQYEFHLSVKASLPVYTSLTDPVALPPEYMEALTWSLVVRLSMSYGLPARPDHSAAMTQALNTMRQANLQISELPLPLPGRVPTDYTSFVGPGLGRAFVLDAGMVL